MNIKLLMKVLIAALVGFSYPAYSAVITFDSLWHVDSGTNTLNSPYAEDGYVFSNLGTSNAAFGVYGENSEHFAGTPNPDPNPTFGDALLFNRASAGTTRITKQDGGTFNLLSIDLAEIVNTEPVSIFSVTFIGELFGGGTVSHALTSSDGVFGKQNLLFTNFTNLTHVDLVQDDRPGFQFDNVEISAIPIPAAVWLFGSGLIGLLVFARRK